MASGRLRINLIRSQACFDEPGIALAIDSLSWYGKTGKNQTTFLRLQFPCTTVIQILWYFVGPRPEGHQMPLVFMDEASEVGVLVHIHPQFQRKIPRQNFSLLQFLWDLPLNVFPDGWLLKATPNTPAGLLRSRV